MITLGDLTGFRRRVLRDGCLGKLAFPSYAKAESAMGGLFRKRVHRPELGDLNVYLCQWCGRYHIGHRSKRMTETR